MYIYIQSYKYRITQDVAGIQWIDFDLQTFSVATSKLRGVPGPFWLLDKRTTRWRFSTVFYKTTNHWWQRMRIKIWSGNPSNNFPKLTNNSWTRVEIWPQKTLALIFQKRNNFPEKPMKWYGSDRDGEAMTQRHCTGDLPWARDEANPSHWIANTQLLRGGLDGKGPKLRSVELHSRSLD